MALGEEQPVAVKFTGTRREMGGLLLRGYGLLLPTIGLYRFWLTTWKRRFYWAHTEIDGDALEYTGNASQLLLGFLMAVSVFVPLYGLFFYLSTLSQEAALLGYGGVAVLVWFLMGYATYRARDFRLSRTLWRGIRFDQAGSAWNYAFRRFFWSLLVVATAGLAYPFMAATLWGYRYRNSWFGDRQWLCRRLEAAGRPILSGLACLCRGRSNRTDRGLAHGGAAGGRRGRSQGLCPDRACCAVDRRRASAVPGA